MPRNAEDMPTSTGPSDARTATTKKNETTVAAARIDAMEPSAIAPTAVVNTAVGTDAAMDLMSNDKVPRGRSTAHPLFSEKNGISLF